MLLQGGMVQCRRAAHEPAGGPAAISSWHAHAMSWLQCVRSDADPPQQLPAAPRRKRPSLGCPELRSRLCCIPGLRWPTVCLLQPARLSSAG